MYFRRSSKSSYGNGSKFNTKNLTNDWVTDRVRVKSVPKELLCRVVKTERRTPVSGGRHYIVRERCERAINTWTWPRNSVLTTDKTRPSPRPRRARVRSNVERVLFLRSRRNRPMRICATRKNSTPDVLRRRFHATTPASSDALRTWRARRF